MQEFLGWSNQGFPMNPTARRGSIVVVRAIVVVSKDMTVSWWTVTGCQWVAVVDTGTWEELKGQV